MINILDGLERKEKAKESRKRGFIPGNIYGINLEGKNITVKFDVKKFKKYLKNNSVGSKVKVIVKGREIFCVIKNIQYDKFNSKPLHIDFYSTDKENIVKVKVPIKFNGKGELIKNRLMLNVFKKTIQIKGKLKELPESISIDVDKITKNEIITVGDIKLSNKVTILENKTAVLGVVMDVSAQDIAV